MTITTLQGKNFVISGKIAGEDRNSAAAKVCAAGGHFQKSVTNATDVLIIGADVGATKRDAALAKGVAVITWADAVKLMSGMSASVQETAPPTAVSPISKPPSAVAPARQVLPMKCKKSETIPSGDYVYEMKWDGYRCVAHVNGTTSLASSEGNDFNERFPHVVAELDTWVVPCVLDGELAVLDEDGHSRFFNLHAGDSRQAKYVVFDVLEAQGIDVRNEPWTARRELLETIFAGAPGGGAIALGPVFDDGEELLGYARDNGLEGIVAKPKVSLYKEGSRSAWLKIKIRQTQEFVVIGYTAGEGARAGTAGALLLAVREKGPQHDCWRYVGSAGSGGTYEDFQQIVSRTFNGQPGLKGPTEAAIATGGIKGLDDLSKAELRKITFCTPTVVITVDFAGWSPGGKLFHPSIKGIRDRDPMTVVRET